MPNMGHSSWCCATGGIDSPLLVQSPRAGRDYEITETAIAMIEGGALDERAKAKLTTMLIDRRHEGEDPSIVDSIMLEEVKNVPLLADKERAEYLLRYIADQESSSPGLAVRIGYPIVPGALAHSESWTDSQVKTLVFYMEGAQWVKVVRTLDGMTCSLTSDGHVHLDAMREEPKGRQVFVAMWFDSGMADAYEHGIAPGIQDAGFIPVRIDEKKNANRIDDDIINEIKKSRFVVADMTHGAHGVRGSVYYEAGFALGHGLEVIYCCRQDCMEGLVFDTRQYHHIVWETPVELRRKLAERIRARIGSLDKALVAKGSQENPLPRRPGGLP